MLGNIGKEIGKEVAEGLAKKATPKVVPAAKNVVPKVVSTKKPLKWGFKGRKETDIQDLESNDFTNIDKEWDKLLKIAIEKPNTKLGIVIRDRLDEIERNPALMSFDTRWHTLKSTVNNINGEFNRLQSEDVPRELTGKMFQNKLGTGYLNKIRNNINQTYYTETNYALLKKDNNLLRKIIQQKNNEDDRIEEDWKKGWLRFYNELDKNQQETFQVLSDTWMGSPNELVDTVKRLV